MNAIDKPNLYHKTGIVVSVVMEAFATLYAAEYYQRFLSHNVRPDGRPTTACRKITVTTGVYITPACQLYIHAHTCMSYIHTHTCMPDIHTYTPACHTYTSLTHIIDTT